MKETDFGNAPVFVKVDEYKDVLDIVGLLKDKLREAKTTLGKINDLKNHEDSDLEAWSNTLNDIEKKVEYIDKALFEPESL
mgnify:CR=1 FL=1